MTVSCDAEISRITIDTEKKLEKLIRFMKGF